jgi:hypothetical protein
VELAIHNFADLNLRQIDEILSNPQSPDMHRVAFQVVPPL